MYEKHRLEPTRAKERSEFHRNETLRKVAEQSGQGAEKVLEVIREEERIAQRKRIEGLKLGGLITSFTRRRHRRSRSPRSRG